MVFNSPMLNLDWYYSIEVEPDIWTPGKDFPPIALTRAMLERCPVAGMTCLDVGTMDGFVPVLLCRRGAATVVACDRYDRRPQIDFIKRKLGVEFSYLHGMTIRDVRTHAPKVLQDPFDLIVFSGVLYHMYDPMVGLALIRSMARPGGIVLVETYAVLSERAVGYFNAFGNIESDIHNYWNWSVGLLDYLLRYFRLKPLDCRYFEVKGAGAEDGSKVIRVCVPCEAVTSALSDPGDTFMNPGQRDDDVEFPMWLPGREQAPMHYQSDAHLPRRHNGSVDLYAAVTNSDPLPMTKEACRLELPPRKLPRAVDARAGLSPMHEPPVD